PGMGKSALAMQIVQAAELGGDRSNWGVISLEMSTAELTGRLICREARADTKHFADGTVNATVWQRCIRAAEQVKGYPVRIDDRSGLTWAQIAGKARKWSLLHGLQGLVIDYAQLIRKRDPRMSNNDHVTEVSQGAKALAKSLDVPVLLLSQLNRQCEQRQDKRPMCSDLRDSGSLEQDADVVLMLYREDVYRPVDEANDNTAEVIIRKHRGGPCGTIRLNWSGYCARFDDLHVYGD
ncbi:MAG: DnaB-like helicase C-terminal domain-containing protein, partial [Hyphomicrobium sp.]